MRTLRWGFRIRKCAVAHSCIGYSFHVYRTSSLHFEQGAFSLNTPAIAAKPTVSAQYPMARYQHTNAVGCTSGGNRPNRFRLFDSRRKVAIADYIPLSHT